jgi:hypothetical protein
MRAIPLLELIPIQCYLFNITSSNITMLQSKREGIHYKSCNTEKILVNTDYFCVTTNLANGIPSIFSSNHWLSCLLVGLLVVGRRLVD